MNFLNVLHGLSQFIPSNPVFSFPKNCRRLSLAMVLLGTRGVLACLGWAGEMDEQFRHFLHGQVISYLLFEIRCKGRDDLVEGFWLF
jgi:hypothetical protein